MKLIMENWNKFLKEADEYPETALNSPRKAGREWAIKNLADAVDSALGSGLSSDEIRVLVGNATMYPGGHPDRTAGFGDDIREVIVHAFDRRSLRGEVAPLREDADDDRDAEIEEATRDGKADGASGSEREGPGGYFQKYYDEAYDRAAKKRTK